MPRGPVRGAPPPRLHWALLLLLGVLTGGIFLSIWMLVQGFWVKKVLGAGAPLAVAAVNLLLGCVYYVLFFETVVQRGGSMSPAMQLIVGGQAVLLVAAAFGMKTALEKFLRRPLSGGMTFFFSVLYIQYHLTNMAKYMEADFYRAS